MQILKTAKPYKSGNDNENKCSTSERKDDEECWDKEAT